MRLAGLETQRLYAVDTNRVMIKVRCPEDRLTDVAEVLRLKLRTNDGKIFFSGLVSFIMDVISFVFRWLCSIP